MKKYGYLAILFFAVMSLSIYAEEQPESRESLKPLFLSWSVSFGGHPEAFSRTSILSFGFIVFHNDKIDIRNQIGFYNGSLVMEALDTSYFKKVLANKLSIGKLTRNGLFRPYGFIEGRIGTCGEELYDFWVNPIVMNVGLGTGIDIYAIEALSYFMEVAFLGNFYESEFLPQQRFELGVMFHF